MATTSRIGAFLDAFKKLLDARTGLSGVRVFTAPVDPPLLSDEFIMLGGDEIGMAWEQKTITGIGETMDIPCFIESFKPGGTKLSATTYDPDETVVSAARDRALAILEQVYDQIEDYHESTIVNDIHIIEVKLAQMPAEDSNATIGRICRISFTMRATAIFNPAT